MDNIKNFIGNVMTTGQHGTDSAAAKHQQTERNMFGGVGGTSAFLPATTGRNRTVSESSNVSDLSTASSTMDGTTINRQIKRKDSEPYFWIM